VTFEPVGEKPVTVDTAKPSKTLGWVALIGGGALMVVGGGLLIAREGVISDINDLCPNKDSCNPQNRNVVNDKTDTANLYQPLGIGFLAVGAIAAGYGVYAVFIKKAPPPSDPQQPAQGNATSRIDVGPRYIRGGAMLGLSGTF
jgi:drug/metabolite transporter (DMT)-like permease